MTLLSGTLNINAKGAQLQCDLGNFLITDPRLSGINPGKHKGFFEIQKIMPHAISNPNGTLQFTVLAVLKRFAFCDMTAHVSLSKSLNQKQLSLLDALDDESLSFLDAPQTDQVDFLSDKSVLPSVVTSAETDDQEESDHPLDVMITPDGEFSAPKTRQEKMDVISVDKVDSAYTGDATNDCMEIENTESDDADADTDLPSTVWLDATLSREALREEVAHLRSHGYQFDSQEQVWRRPLAA